MKIPTKQVIERTINNTATSEEAKEVIRWFATPEGRACLSSMMDDDAEKMFAGMVVQYVDHPVPTERMSGNIHKRIRRKRFQRILLRTAAIIIFVALLLGQFIYINNQVYLFSRAEYKEIYAPRGERMQVILQDGSKVVLNADSRIRYPKKFALFERRINLEGEAYFEITPNKNCPFRIGVAEIDIVVHGTEFDVKAYPDDMEISVALETGKVSLSVSSRALVDLSPGEQVVYNKKNRVCRISKPEKIANNSAWKNNQIIFDANPLEDVLASLSRYYDVKFSVVDSAALRYAYTLTTSSKKQLQQVLSDLEKITPVRFREGNDCLEVFIEKNK
jgi:ferric-dicitrate binding protein FerR (iron transport regulator)